MEGVSLRHPVQAFFFFFFFLNLGSFSYTSRAVFFFSPSVFFSFFFFFFFFLSFFLSVFYFFAIGGISLTHPVLPSFLYREFLLHTPCWLRFFFYLGSFSYTSRAGFSFYGGSFSYTSQDGFIFIAGVSLTHPMLASFLSREFL